MCLIRFCFYLYFSRLPQAVDGIDNKRDVKGSAQGSRWGLGLPWQGTAAGGLQTTDTYCLTVPGAASPGSSPLGVPSEAVREKPFQTCPLVSGGLVFWSPEASPRPLPSSPHCVLFLCEQRIPFYTGTRPT